MRADDKIVGAADGQIVGWLPAEKADYISDITHVPVALWHVLYDEEGLGEEDLEEFEVREAIDSFERDEWEGMGEDADACHLEQAAAAGTCSSLSPGAHKGSGGGCGGAAAHIQRSFPEEGDRGEGGGVTLLGRRSGGGVASVKSARRSSRRSSSWRRGRAGPREANCRVVFKQFTEIEKTGSCWGRGRIGGS